MNNKVYDTPVSRELPELRNWLKDTINKFGDKDPVIIRPDPKPSTSALSMCSMPPRLQGWKNLTFS